MPDKTKKLGGRGQRAVADNGQEGSAAFSQPELRGRGQSALAINGQTGSAAFSQPELREDSQCCDVEIDYLQAAVLTQPELRGKGQLVFAQKGQNGDAQSSQPELRENGPHGNVQMDHSEDAVLTQAEIIDLIRAHHRIRCYAMESRKAAHLRLGAYLRSELGWSVNKPEKERKAIAAQAQALIKKPAGSMWEHIIVMSLQAGLPFENIEKTHLKEMERLAELLPAWMAFGEGVRGFGRGSLAVIVAEAGDLANYSTKSKLWKRMGLAVMDGRRQGHVAKGLSRDDRAAAYMEHGYSPKRRSRVWNIGDALIKGNGDGVYRSAYLKRKEYERARDPEMKPIHAHRRAQRYMEKRLLRDLWQAWGRAEPELAKQPKPGAPAPEIEQRAAP